MNNYTKALWVAKQTGHDVDDVMDVILGNITHPSQFVAEVEMYAGEYDNDHELHTSKARRELK